MAPSGQMNAAADPAAVSARAVRLVTGALGPISRMLQRLMIGFVAAGGFGLGAGLIARDELVTLGVGLWLSAVAAVLALFPLADPELRAAVELVHDHDCHERAEWKAETGTSMPRGLKAAEKWVARHPTGPGRASLLLPLGRLEEADRAIDAIESKTPEEAFSVEILRRSRELLAGDTPDLSSLVAGWRDLPDPRERRHRRECLALLEAQIAVDQGGDAIAVLATARHEIGEVYRTMRTPWLLVRWAGFAVLFTLTATVVVAALTN